MLRDPSTVRRDEEELKIGRGKVKGAFRKLMGLGRAASNRINELRLVMMDTALLARRIQATFPIANQPRKVAIPGMTTIRVRRGGRK
jgi:hypothetical protein